MKTNHTIWAAVALGICLARNKRPRRPDLERRVKQPLVLGEVIPQVLSPPGQEARDLAMANTLIGMYPTVAHPQQRRTLCLAIASRPRCLRR